MINQKDIIKIKIRLAAPEEIVKYSFGELTSPATISYKNQIPEKNGLFCQKIFGPVRDFVCECNKYTQPKDRGKICEICGVESTRSIVRRERFGHIKLVTPVTHIWMLKAMPSKIAIAINIKSKEAEEITYYISYIVIDPGKTSLKKFTIISQKNCRLIFSNELNDLNKRISKEGKDCQYNEEERDFIFESIEYYLGQLNDITYNYSFTEILEFICEYDEAIIETGAESIKKILKSIKIEEEIAIIKKALSSGIKTNIKLLKRLWLFEAFRTSGNRPEWMVLDVIPVLPPDLRPIVMLDGNKYTASEINELYRRIIVRNERLKEIISKNPSKIILNNEKRLLQEAVDSLIDNSRRDKPLLGKNKRVLKSLCDALKGKAGRFRQNLLGKRVDYSARSVIVVGPHLKMYQCGLPKKIALELYKPFIVHKIMQDNDQSIYNPKVVEKLISDQDDIIWEYLDQAIHERPVLLNRAPTLHRLGIQAFEPILTNGKAIQLHPLSTTAFNADFDGDQMAVYLPIRDESVAEARYLMLGSYNIIGLKDGRPIACPTQDMILGVYYLTIQKYIKNQKTKFFSSLDNVVHEVTNGNIELHEIILFANFGMIDKKIVKNKENVFLITTPGTLIFNSALSKTQRFYNNRKIKKINKHDLVTFSKKYKDIANYFTSSDELVAYLEKKEYSFPFNEKTLNNIFAEIYDNYGNNSGKYLDNIKNLGFKYSTKSAITISPSDIEFLSKKKEDKIAKFKQKIIEKVSQKVKQINNFYGIGMLTKESVYTQKISAWNVAKESIKDYIWDYIYSPEFILNPLYQIIDSGARSNISNLVQLVGIRGLMVSAKGNIIDVPIKSSFKDGLSMIEFFISTHGARKGMADTALKTADSGYLTRRLVDVAQDQIILEEDCFSVQSTEISAIKDNKTDSIIIPLSDRLFGRISFDNIYDKDNVLIIPKNGIFDVKIIKKITKNNITKVKIRSTLNCETKGGICRMCFGFDLSENKLVKLNSPVGVIAAQSIGEPGTQLTMRTFHTGGVAGGKDITQGLPRVKEILDVVKPNGLIAQIFEVEGTVTKIENIGNLKRKVTVEREYYNFAKDKQVEIDEYIILHGEILRAKVNDKVKTGDKITDGNINLKELIEITDIYKVQNYILKEIIRVYNLQGIYISEKYIEIIIKKMVGKIYVTYDGDSEFVLGTFIDLEDFETKNNELLKNGLYPSQGHSVIMGIKRVPLESKSFLSSISFQETVRVLTNSAILGKVDYLNGIKENVILGKLIPCGSGKLSNDIIIEKGNFSRQNEY